MGRTKQPKGICGKLKADNTRCTNRAGCKVAHPPQGASEAGRPAIVAGMRLTGHVDFLDFVVDNEDYWAMSENVTAEDRALALSHSGDTSVPREDQVDFLGYWLNEDASDEIRSLSHAVHADSTSREIETACVVGSELLHAMERDQHERGPDPDLRLVRQVMCCIAAHPEATDTVVRQAVRAEGKYAAREVLKYHSDPEMLEFTLKNADVGVWHAANDDGVINPALPSHRLDAFVETVNRPSHSIEEAEYRANQMISLRNHPNVTAQQIAALPGSNAPASSGASGNLCEVHENDTMLRTQTVRDGVRVRGGFSGDKVLFDFNGSAHLASDRLVMSAEKADEFAALLEDESMPDPDDLNSQESVFEDSEGRTVTVVRTPVGLSDWNFSIVFDPDDNRRGWRCDLTGIEGDEISRLATALSGVLRDGEAGDFEAGDWDY